MLAIRNLTAKSMRSFLKLWSWVLLFLLGLLTTVTGCVKDSATIMYGVIPAYGIQPMYGVQVGKYLLPDTTLEKSE
jgi:hypothetical protein